MSGVALQAPLLTGPLLATLLALALGAPARPRTSTSASPISGLPMSRVSRTAAEPYVSWTIAFTSFLKVRLDLARPREVRGAAPNSVDLCFG